MQKILKIFSLALLIFLFQETSAQKYSKVEFQNTSETAQTLINCGIPLDNAFVDKNKIVIELSGQDLQKIQAQNINYTILIDDVSKFYKERLATPKTIVRTPRTPDHFNLGSMGGELTYEEMLAELTEMHQLYPNLITVRAAVDDTLTTHNDSLIYWVKISDNPNIDEDEPEVLYTGVHHAREPISMMNLIYYMWYLLENYDTDPQVQYLVDNFEQYFIPIVNPDGYKYNQAQEPNGGGMWRKNRRDNGDGTWGVDPNRNYPYMWGYDDSGSSPDSDDDTYRGPSAGSEPEVQNVMHFIQNHDFKILNHQHTYSNLMIYPYGYDENAENPDLDIFIKYAQIMTRENHYSCGRGWELLYPVNGDADDWAYGEAGVFAFTSETGSFDDGFWPSQDRIIPLCEGNLDMNISMCLLAGQYAEVQDKNITSLNRCGFYKFDINFIGLDTTGTFKVYLEGDNIAYSDTVTFTDADYSFFQTITDSVLFDISENVAYNQNFDFYLVADNGQYKFRTPVSKTIRKTDVVFQDDCDNLNNWTSSSWGLSTVEYHSAPSSITDSPNGDYSSNTSTSIVSNTIDLSNYSSATLNFFAKWDIEAGYDYAQLLISDDNGSTWTALSTENTISGNGGVQPSGQPVFEGTQDWIAQSADLSGHSSSTTKIKFILGSDGGVERDGFYFDDLSITTVLDDAAPQITGQNSINFNAGQENEIPLSVLQVSDADDTYPTGFYVLAYAGDNYDIGQSPNIIIPDAGYTGELTVHVKVCDGYKLSDLYDLTANSVENINSSAKEIKIYPNPVSSTLYISGIDDVKLIEITNIQGQTIFQTEHTQQVDFQNAIRGIYFLKIYTTEGLKILKVVKQ